jgi:hypothetical protein
MATQPGNEHVGIIGLIAIGWAPDTSARKLEE